MLDDVTKSFGETVPVNSVAEFQQAEQHERDDRVAEEDNNNPLKL
jgi:hypothetical protein